MIKICISCQYSNMTFENDRIPALGDEPHASVLRYWGKTKPKIVPKYPNQWKSQWTAPSDPVTHQWRRWAAGRPTPPLLWSGGSGCSPALSGPTAARSPPRSLRTPTWPFRGWSSSTAPVVATSHHQQGWTWTSDNHVHVKNVLRALRPTRRWGLSAAWTAPRCSRCR